MIVELGKKYKTRAGRSVRILCTDMRGTYPVVGIICLDDEHNGDYIGTWKPDGSCGGLTYPNSKGDLVEVSPYEDWPIDTPIWCRRTYLWHPRYFAGVDADGSPITWEDGCTSFTQTGKTTWAQARLASEFTPDKQQRI